MRQNAPPTFSSIAYAGSDAPRRRSTRRRWGPVAPPDRLWKIGSVPPVALNRAWMPARCSSRSTRLAVRSWTGPGVQLRPSRQMPSARGRTGPASDVGRGEQRGAAAARIGIDDELGAAGRIDRRVAHGIDRRVAQGVDRRVVRGIDHGGTGSPRMSTLAASPCACAASAARPAPARHAASIAMATSCARTQRADTRFAPRRAY